MKRTELSNLLHGLPEADVCVTENVPFSLLTTFRLGGSCAYLLQPRSAKALADTLALLSREGVPFHTLGRGSNVLAPDGVFEGVVLQTEKAASLQVCGNELHAEAGVSLLTLTSTAADAGLTGLEFAYGIPGSVGGALYMNAGAYDGVVGDVVSTTQAAERDGSHVTLTHDEQAFGARESVFQKKPLTVLSSVFSLSKGEDGKIRARMRELMERRKTSQPLEYPSAGSVFKRPAGHFAGKLIQDAGLKGYRIGDAEVSEKHAGFIINRGNAKSADVRALIEFIQKTVYEQFGVTLCREVRYFEEL